jgi:hypothetical protein
MQKKQMIGYAVFFIVVCIFGYLIYTQGIIISDQTVFPKANQATSENKVAVQSVVGNDKDEHGCIGSAGYAWCEVKKKCLRTWEEKCEADNSNVAEDDFTIDFNDPYKEIRNSIPNFDNSLKEKAPEDLQQKLLQDAIDGGRTTCKNQKISLKDLDYSFDSIDLNSDGVKEFIVTPISICGDDQRGASSNGEYFIFQETNNGWKDMAPADFGGDSYYIKNKKTDGYYDIILYWHMSSSSGEAAYYKWNRTTGDYEESSLKNIMTADSGEDLSDDPDYSNKGSDLSKSGATTWDAAGIADPIAFKEFLLSLRASVLAHDKNNVVKHVNIEKYSQNYVGNNYDNLFNQKVLKAFQDLNIHQIWRGSQGAMIADGTVWFKENNDSTFSIYAINS